MRPRTSETLWFEEDVEVRSRPTMIVLLEFWFLWVHEIISHKLHVQFPRDKTWGEPFEAAFHVFYTWTLNFDERIDKSAKITRFKDGPQ